MGAPLALHAGWTLSSTPAGACSDPQDLDLLAPEWLPAQVPGTAAASLRAAGRWSLEAPDRRFDAEDWWFRTAFTLAPDSLRQHEILEFAGLATHAEVWLNGSRVLIADNMHRSWRVDVRGRLREHNELWICCRALDAFLAAKRPRPRWRTPMVEHQQLRWARTTLLGRTPGWSPPAAAVGPWRAIHLWSAASLALHDARPDAALDGTTGIVRLSVPSAALAGAPAPMLRLARGDQHWQAPLLARSDGTHGAELRIADVQRWWPHTHGEPALYRAALTGLVNDAEHTFAPVGFRALHLDHGADGDAFTLQVNGRAVFCRGACWTPLDVVSLSAEPGAYASAIAQARTAGFNMLRVGGTMVYEADAFYRECDRQGVLVWQDFMFANMDYPAADEAFLAGVRAEAGEFLQRRGTHPCLALLCGNSEGAQQAAMWGAPRSLWQPALFHDVLPTLCRERLPQVPYWPSSTHGGAFPHAPDSGSTSYYGLGAYLRPPEDARRASVRFASECLAFANVPEPATLQRLAGDNPLRVHQPRWKQRSPRDLGAGWDFDDVRDHYLRHYFNVDPLALRYADHDRYLACSREAAAAAMRDGFAEWRRPRSGCGGALIWFLRDLWDGAGWGIVDADGTPKAGWHALRPLLQPCALWLTDEGNNGPALHVVNESDRSGPCRLQVTLYRQGAQVVERSDAPYALQAGEARTLPLAACFEQWLDVSHAFRFGPALTDVVHVALTDAAGAPLAEHVWLPLGPGSLGQHDLGIEGRWESGADGRLQLCLCARRYAHAVCIDAPGLRSERQYFPLLPGREERITLARTGDTATRLTGARVQALNGLAPLHLPPP